MTLNISILLEDFLRLKVTNRSKKVLVKMYAVETSYSEVPMRRME